MRRFIRPTLIWLIVLAAIFLTADTLTSSVNTSTLISLIWGIVSPFIGKIIPLKGGPIVLVSYFAPLAVVAAAVLFVDGTSHWNWTTFLIDVAVAYAANQAIFNGAAVTVPAAVK